MDLIVLLVAAAVVTMAFTGSRFKPGEWYTTLQKPWWTPPGYVFPLVWTILYFMIGVAGVRVLRHGNLVAIFLWWQQGIFNATWSYLFFGLHQMNFALADILLLWSTILAFIAIVLPQDSIAALLFVPYLIWVSIATALNKKLVDLNPDKVAPLEKHD